MVVINVEFTEKEIDGLLNALKIASDLNNTKHLIGGPEDAPDVLYKKIRKIYDKR